MPFGRRDPGDFRIQSKTAIRFLREGRLEEYEEARRGLACEGITSGAQLKKRIDEMLPPLTEEEILERQLAGTAPSEAEVEERVGRDVQANIEARSKPAEGRQQPKPAEPAAFRLYRRERFKTAAQQLSAAKEVEWVKNHLAISDVGPEDAPSPGAWAMLESYRRTPHARQYFWEKIYAGMLPRRQEIEAQERFRDDGRKLDDMADGVKKMADLAVERAKEQWERLEAQARGKP